mgnify:CR=1 FL=1|tara:strand:+ start:39749 stop:42004 length:2256 start_codon:yes stop_codon:yes gene_type:complete
MIPFPFSSLERLLRRGVSASCFIGLSICSGFSPDGSVPGNLDDLMPSSWDLTTVSNQIWVAPGGTGDGTSESSPLGVIQSAIDEATPGTVILVKAGTYLEDLAITKGEGVANGTNSSPILLVSADGPEQAVIQSSGNVTTVRSSRISNWGVIGFKIIGSGSKTSGDNSPVKLGATDITAGDPCNNWLIAGNRISGQGRDGTKYYSGRNIHWIGNTYDGDWGQEGCDHVIVGVQNTNGDDNQFAFNTVGGSALYTAITLKMGTNNFQIFNNDFQIDAGSAAIRLGGNGTLLGLIDEIPYQTEPDFDPQTGVKIRVLYNRFTADVGTNVQFYGSRGCEVSYNDLSNPNASKDLKDGIADLDNDANGDPYLFTPDGNLVTDNKIVSSTPNVFTGALDDGLNYTISGNSSTVVFNYPVGASHLVSHISALISTLRDGPSTDITLVENGDFETGDDSSWNTTGASIQSSITHDGSAYAAMVTPSGNYRKAIQEDIPVLAGETLSAEGFVRMSGFDGVHKVVYQLRFYDTDAGGLYNGTVANPVSAGNVSIASMTETVNDDWEHVSAGNLIVPNDADIMTVWLAAQQSPTGSVYFDDIGVYASDVLPGAQLLLDPDFANSNNDGDWTVHSSASIAATAGMDGSPALHQPAGTAYTASSQEVDITGMSTLNASGYIKTNNLASGKSALIQVRFYNSSDVKIGSESVGSLGGTSGDYVQFINAAVAVPSGAEYATLRLAVNGGGQGEAWFDDLQLKNAP